MSKFSRHASRILAVGLAAATLADAAMPARKTEGCNIAEDQGIRVSGLAADVRPLAERLASDRAFRDRSYRPTLSEEAYYGESGSFKLEFHPWLDLREITGELQRLLVPEGRVTTRTLAIRTVPQVDWCFPSTGFDFPWQWVSEHHDAARDHYRLAASDAERDALRAEGRWVRTGEGFRSYGPNYASCSRTFHQVVRFVGVPGSAPDTHFLTADSRECGTVWRQPEWHLKDRAFYARVPFFYGPESACHPEMLPVYRFYNGRAAEGRTNHRYVTSWGVRLEMLRQGWHEEGIAFCVWQDPRIAPSPL